MYIIYSLGKRIYNILYIPLYRRLPEDSDLSLKHVRGFRFMYSIQFCCVHMMVCIDEYQVARQSCPCAELSIAP
jgi:hypothetical protein